MKFHYLLVLFVLLFTSKLAVAQTTTSTYEEPQWKMHFYFEDATGVKDTLTIGYDPTAHRYIEEMDIQFGEVWEEIDTTQFNVYIYKDNGTDFYYPTTPPIDTNLVTKTNVSDWPYPQVEFGWVHGQPPITITWDDEMLDSENLPNVFVNLDDYPRARIDLWVDYWTEWMIPDCIEYFEDPTPPIAMLSSSPDYLSIYSSCVFRDELSFDIESSNEIGDVMDTPFFILEPYDDFWWLDTEVYVKQNVNIYPIPTYNYLYIDYERNVAIDFVITDVYGKEIKNDVIEGDMKQIDVSSLANGVYFIKTEHFTTKFIKL